MRNMFRKLFGESEAQEVVFLQVRVIITIISFIMCFFGLTELFALVMLFIWGWPVVKSLFGIASVGALFTGNVILGSCIFVIYVILSYILGLVFAFIGTGRYIYLLVKRYTRGKK